MEKSVKIEKLKQIIEAEGNCTAIESLCCSPNECPIFNGPCGELEDKFLKAKDMLIHIIGMNENQYRNNETEITQEEGVTINKRDYSNYDCGVSNEVEPQVEPSEVKHGVKHDNGKPDMNLLLTPALIEVGKIMTFGKKKYAPYNYRGLDSARLISAAIRHLVAHNSGIDFDEETGEKHLAHAAAGLLMALQCSLEGKDGVKLSDTDKE